MKFEKIESVSERKEDIIIYGLASLVMVAGVSKFFQPGVWAAYEPGFITTLSPVSQTTHMYAAGIIESTAAVLIFLRKRVFEVSAFLTLWLTSITLGVLSNGFWSIALRDLAWVLLAGYVALNTFKSEEN